MSFAIAIILKINYLKIVLVSTIEIKLRCLMAKLDTKNKMVYAAIDLFHRQGVNATSIDQILESSGTGKSQFSHYFKNKEGLVHAALTHLHALISSGEAQTGYEIRSWKEMDQWFQGFIDFQKSVNFERSCPIGTIGNDVTCEQETLRKDVVEFLSWSRGQLARFFREKKRTGELLKNTDPDALADFCIAIMQGGMLLTKMKRSSDMFENAAG
ncbi:MAG: TetR family transcriptional regulator, partial [Sphingobacteriales bacterium]